MASGSFNLSRTGSTSSYITFKCAWSSTANIAANTSTVTVIVTASKGSGSTANTYGSQTTTVNVGGASQSVTASFTIAPSKTITLFTKSYTIAHNADGTKDVSISATVGGNAMWGSGSATVTLDKIPRYATVNQSLVAKTETTATIKWTSDTTVDYIWYSTNNGSSWTGINVADGTSGQYTLSGLSAGTTYQVKTRVRRKDSQLTTDSTALSVVTYSYPYANSMPNFTIGNKLTIGLYNPLGRSVTVNIFGADGSQISNDTTAGTSITGYNGTTVVNRLYSSIPNAKSGTYKVKVTYGTQITTKTGGTYTVNANVCKPSIGSCAYKDVNSTSVAITGNNQDIVQNQSKVQYSAAGLTANYNATIKACSVTVNGTSYSLTISGTNASGGSAVINSGTDVDAVFTVTDSRGLTATKTITVNMLAWSVPSAIITLERQDNYYTQTNLKADADYPSINGNNMITITYTATENSGTAASVSGTLQDNVTAVVNLDNTYAWTVAVTLEDSFGGKSMYTAFVSRGMPIIYFDRIKSSVGINCFPVEEQSLEVNGINLSRSVMTRSLSANVTSLAVTTYANIPLNLSNAFGGKLTATEGGGIRIGANISKVLVSGRMMLQTGASAGLRYFRICKNSYSNSNTLGWANKTIAASTQESIEITPILADVQEGDIIYLMYHVPIATDAIQGNTYGCRTSLTVETIA